MKNMDRIFRYNNAVRGTVLIEFLLTIALAGTLIPFVYSYQQRALERTENARIVRQMQKVQSVLERYIVDNREKMLTTIGRNIIRVKLSELQEYGLDESFVKDASDKYQIRILKSSDSTGQSSLQGVVVLTDSEITPMRTREIVSMGDDKLGFVDGVRAYGGFGTWRTDVAELGIDANSGIVQTTSINRDNALYLWRVPSDNISDATMMSPLNLGGRDIKNASFVNSGGLVLDELFESNSVSVTDLIFSNRTTIDSEYKTQTAIVSGSMSGDSRSIFTDGTFNLAEYAKVSSFTTDNLWVNNLTLGGLSVASGGVPTLHANGSLDMTEGRVSALYVSVGFTGSMTSRLSVRQRIEDSTNPSYYWDVASQTANLADINSPTLSDMASKIFRVEYVSGSTASRIFGSVVTNKNATMGDYLNAISEIQSAVRGKYRLLKLE